MKMFLFLCAFPFFGSLPVLAEDSFDRYDTNRDGTVTYEELNRAKKLEFDQLDRNRDFSISAREFAALNEDPPSEFDLFHFANLAISEDAFAISLFAYQEQIRLVINRLDTTADNAVSQEEYDAAVAELKARSADPLAPKVRPRSLSIQ